MTDDMELSGEEIIRAVQHVLSEFAPHADPRDVEEFLATLRECDPEELEVNLGQGFGQFCEGEEACNAAFARYAELVGATSVSPNPSSDPQG